MAIGALLKRAYPTLKESLSRRVTTLKECLSKMVAAARLTISRISTSLNEISFLAVAKRKLTSFAQVVVIGVCRLAGFCFWAFLIYLQINQITNRPNTVRAHTPATVVSDTYYCPTPTGGFYAGNRIEPEWRAGVSPRNCPQGYGVRSGYPTYSALYATESTPASDCPPARKGRKSKRAVRPCTVENPPVAEYIGGDDLAR